MTEVTPNQSENPDESIGSSVDEVAPKKTRKPRQTSIDKQLERIELMLDSALGGATKFAELKNPFDAMVLQAGAPNLKQSILDLSREDKKVRDWLFDLSTSNLYLNVVAASLAIIIPILYNHNLIPPLFQKRKKPENTNGDETTEQLSFA